MPNPIQGARVEIYKNDKLIDYRYTDVTGSCDFDLPQDIYKVKVSKENYKPHEQIITLNTDIIKTVYLEKKPYKLIETLMRARLVDAISVKEKGIETKILTVATTQLSDRIDVVERPLTRLSTPAFTRLSDSINVLERTEQKVITTTPTQLSDNINISEYTTNASGIDPNDPTWAPADGWTTVWEFKDPAELDDFANMEQTYAYVENDELLFNPPSDHFGIASRSDSYPIKKFAICIKTTILSAGLGDIVEVESDDGIYKKALSFRLTNTGRLRLIDYINGNYVDFDNPNDFIIFVVDFENNVARVYDRNKNILAELNLSSEPYTGAGYYIYIWEYNEYQGITDDVEVDWIAIKE